MELFEKQLTSKQLFDGKIIKLYYDEVELPNGKMSFREIVRHSGAVCVIPVDDEGYVTMIRQFRYPFGRPLLEIPAGKLEPNEEPLSAVSRELEEESGIRADKIESLGIIYTTVAFTDEKIYAYLATGLTYHDSHPDDDEFLEIEKIHISKLVEMVMNGEIKDSKTQICILKANAILNSRGNK